MSSSEKINYVEFAAKDISATKRFFEHAFGWSFVDYGPEYTAFSGSGIDGGFYQADMSSLSSSGGALIVLLSDNLEASYAKVVKLGGVICKEIFSFPGGSRFHFIEPSGNELAIWCLSEDS